MKLEEYMYRSQLPRMQYIIGNYERSAEIRKSFPDPYHKVCAVSNKLTSYRNLG